MSETSTCQGIPPDEKKLPDRDTATGILDLPRELRDHLISYLSASSAVSLKLSCRSLYHSGPALALLYYLARKTPEDRYEWILMQERLGRCDGKLACHGCGTLHDIKLFTPKEREKESGRRTCIGRQQVLYLSPKRFIPFSHFGDIGRYLLRDTTYTSYAWGWFCYHHNGKLYELPPNSADITVFPLQGYYHWTRRSNGLLSLSAYLTIRMDSVDAEVQTCISIHRELQKFPFNLCRHLRSDTRRIAKAVHKAQRRRTCESKKKRRVVVQCLSCDCKPCIEVNDACKTVIIYARRAVGRASAADPEWLAQAEYISTLQL